MIFHRSRIVFRKAKDQAQYPHDIDALLDDLRSIRLASTLAPKGRGVSYQIEKIPAHLKTLASVLNIDTISLPALKYNFSDYTSA